MTQALSVPTPTRVIQGAVLVVTLSLTATCLPVMISAAQSTRPNIVMVMADDMRVDDLKYMPRVRRLIRGTGIEFKNSFSPYPLCCPARASFLTGTYAHNHKVFSHDEPYGFGSFDDSKTIATALHRNGYNTGFVGKYLNGYGVQRSRVTGERSHRYVPAGWTDWHGAVERPDGVSWTGETYNYFNTPYNVNGRIDATHRGEYQTNTLGAKTRHLVEKYAGSRKPFFIYLSSVAPHHGSPVESDDPRPIRRTDGLYTEFKTPARPAWVKGRFDKAITHGPGLPADGSPTEQDMSDKPAMLASAPDLNTAERRALVNITRQRAESLYVLDKEIGRIIAKLKRTGEWNNTVFMFTADNGYFLGEHRVRYGKIKPHEPSLRVPFLITGPGIAKNQVRYDPITTIGITATIADYARVTTKLPYPAEGTSVRAALTRGDQGWNRVVVYEAIAGKVQPLSDRPTRKERARGFDSALTASGIRTGRYKYIRYASGALELYDLLLDPNEMRSVHRDSAYGAVREDLYAIWKWYKTCKGTGCVQPMPVPYRVTPAESASITDHQSRARIARYGR